MSENHHKFFRSFVEPVLKSAANNIGRQLLDAVDDPNQPVDIVLEKVVTALKSGALATGQEVLRSRFGQSQ